MSKQPAPAVDSRARPAPAPVLATEAIEDERLAAVRRYDAVELRDILSRFVPEFSGRGAKEDEKVVPLKRA